MKDIIKKVKKSYPKMAEEEINTLINEALQQETIQNMIVNYICYVKERTKRESSTT